MTTWFPSLSSSFEILVHRQILLNFETVGISRISRLWMNHGVRRGIGGRVPCGTRVRDTWYMGGPSVMPSNLA